jgi:hypothetical protein
MNRYSFNYIINKLTQIILGLVILPVRVVGSSKR